jgi:hypothetical protein
MGTHGLIGGDGTGPGFWAPRQHLPAFYRVFPERVKSGFTGKCLPDPEWIEKIEYMISYMFFTPVRYGNSVHSNVNSLKFRKGNAKHGWDSYLFLM